MCGIAGFNLSEREHRLDVPYTLASNLLRQIEKRGRDAAGCAWRNPDREVWIQKEDVPASTFIKTGLSIDPEATTAILHTRWATLGEPEDNANNHPIDVGGIVGVHNGMIRNHRALFNLLGRDVTRFGEVDSEAIFALLQHGNAHPTDLLDLPEGSMAIAWMKTAEKNPCLRLARGSSSPLIIGGTAGGSFVFASTRSMLRDAVMASGGGALKWSSEVPEGTYLRVRDGRIIETGEFKANAGSTFARQSHRYDRPSAFSKTHERRAIPAPAASIDEEVDQMILDRALQRMAEDQRYEQPSLLSRKRWSNGKGE